MKTRAALVVAVLGAASSVWAQPQTEGSITYTLTAQTATQVGGSWTNAPVLTPGAAITGANQGILFKISMNLSGVPNVTEQHWTPNDPAGTSGTGLLLGFWNGDLNMNGSGNSSGTWSDNSTAWYAINNTQNNQTTSTIRRRTVGPFSTAQLNGDVTAGGGQITNLQPAQFTPDPGSVNPLAAGTVWQGMWIPGNLSGGNASFAAALGSLGLLSQIAIQDNNGTYTNVIAKNVQTLFGPGMTVTIIPGPASLALLGLGGLIAARRRRA